MISSHTMISEETDLWDDTETDHTYDHSSNQEANMDLLYPDLDSESDSDEEDSLFGTEWLDNLCALDHVVSSVQEVKGKLATFIIKLFSKEPVLALFDTRGTCSCISVSLYEQICKKVTIVEKHLRVVQVYGASLGMKGLVKLLIEINSNHFKHLFIVCQNLKQPLLFGMDFAQWCKIGINWDHTRAS